jgi:hypothetical protein
MKIGAWILLLLVIIASIGFYRGWFTLSTQNDGNRDGNIEVKLNVNRDKMDADAKAGQNKVQELTGQNSEADLE